MATDTDYMHPLLIPYPVKSLRATLRPNRISVSYQPGGLLVLSMMLPWQRSAELSSLRCALSFGGTHPWFDGSGNLPVAVRNTPPG